MKELRETSKQAEREKEEAVQAKRDVSDSAKAAQRESAARIVDFSQKNARLLADLTTLRSEYAISG